MTKFLNESGFRRIIKTIKNALSLKADKSELPLLVTYDGTQCDTSIADIYAAFLAGRDVEMNYGYLFKLSLVQCSEGGAIFSANFSDQSIGIKGTISNGVDTWEFSLVDLQERLTSGTNIKTVAGNSLLGSGNVTLNDSDIYHSGEDGEDGNYIDDGDTVDVCLNNLDTAVASKQNTLVSGTNIKTVNHESVLGNGNINLNGSNIDTVVSDPNGDWVAGETIDDILVVKSQALADLEDKVDTGLNKRPIIVDYYHYADMIADSSQRGGTIAWEGDNECFYIYEITNEEWRRIDNEELNQITSITTTESTASGGNNTVTINTTDGTSKTFNVKNGKDGADGVSLGEVALVQTTGDSEESVMSQKAVTEYGRKVTAEDLNGTSDWIRAKLTEQGWEFGKYVASNGSLGTDANYCASFFIPMDMSIRKGHSITFGYMFNAWGNACLACYNESKTFVSGLYYICNANNVRTITISTTDTWDNAAYIRMTCNPNRLNECYILDNTTGEYIFKGDEYLTSLCNGNVDYDVLKNRIIAQELGNSEIITMSQKAINAAIKDEPIRKSVFNGYYVFEDAQSCYSVDSYNIDELKCISSLWVSDGFSANPAGYYYNLKHILGLVKATDPSNNYFSFFCDGYNLYLRLRKNGTNVLNYYIGSTSGVKMQRIFTVFDFYGKTVSAYKREDDSGKITTLLDRYDFSELDLSDLQEVKIATTLGTSHQNKTMFNHVWVNNYIVDYEEQLNRVVYFGQYNPIGSYALKTKPNEPSSYMFTNEGNLSGITITLNDPYHKIVEVDRDTAGLVYNWGFYTFIGVPSEYQTLTYEICKIKFTNITSNLLIRGWSESGGTSHIVDPETHSFTQIPMDASTGTVLEYPIEEGKTYYLIYFLGDGYATRYNHYVGGHFTMEITEPKIFCLGSMNLHAECYDGKYFCGHIPFMSEGNFVPVLYGQFGSIDSPNLTGRIRIKNGNIQVYNGSVWKQINNS